MIAKLVLWWFLIMLFIPGNGMIKTDYLALLLGLYTLIDSWIIRKALSRRPSAVFRLFFTIDLLVLGGCFAVVARTDYWGLGILIPFGCFCNVLVVALNKGRMPVTTTNPLFVEIIAKNANYVLAGKETCLAFLGDAMRGPRIYKTGAFSVGDMIIDIGLIITAVQYVLAFGRA